MKKLLALHTLQGESFLLSSFEVIEHELTFDMETLSIEVFDATDREGYDHLVAENILEFEGIEYVIKRVSDNGAGKRAIKRVTAYRKFYVDMNADYIEATISGTFDIVDVMQFIFGGSPFRVEVHGNFPTITTENFGGGYRLSLFTSALERFGAEFELEERMTGQWVVLRAQIGTETLRQYRYRYNLSGVSREENTEGLCTYIRGYGKPIQDAEGNPTGQYVVMDEYVSPLVAERGYPLIEHEPYHNENITDPETLRRKLMEQLDATQPELTIAVDAVELDDGSTVGLGDRVLTVYEPIKGLAYMTRITAIKRRLDNRFIALDTEVTLSSVRREMTGTLAELNRERKIVASAVDPDGNIKLPQSVAGTTTAITEAKRQLDFRDGITAQNGKQVVRFVRNGIETSPNGGSTFEPAVTGAGVNLNNTYGQLDLSQVFGLEEGLSTLSGTLTTLGDELAELDGRTIVLEGMLPSGKGESMTRPILGPDDDGFFYFDRTLVKMIVWTGTGWATMDGVALDA